MRSTLPLFLMALAISAPVLATEVVPVSQFRSVQLRGGGTVTVVPGATQRVSIELVSNDPLLDSLAFSRGRLGVTVAGSPSLVVPAWPEVARVVEDCRA